MSLNKSLITNLVAALILAAGLLLNNGILFWVGLFALSGALTNWLAVYMLFEKVPGLIGSGVIPNRFQEFKGAIHTLMMEQFFTAENIDKFVSGQSSELHNKLNLTPVIEKVDLAPAFDRLVEVIMNSSFGSMLGMFGGAGALTPLKEPFEKNMKASLIEMTEAPEFLANLQKEIDQPNVMAEIQAKIEAIIDARLQELTPELVKQMVQQMIKQHLGWLVVWGGVFGGLIGLVSTLVSNYLVL